MMKSGPALLCLGAALTLLLLGGCHSMGGPSCSHGEPYTKSTSVPPLRIPAGVDAPDTSQALKLPALNEPAPPQRGRKDPCLDQPPPYKVPKPATPQA
jgi:uncharacterized lipoprotein